MKRDAWKVDHTMGETSPTLFGQYSGFFYVLFDLTSERRMKVNVLKSPPKELTRSTELR